MINRREAISHVASPVAGAHRCSVLVSWLLSFFLLLWQGGFAYAADMEITPFTTFNQSPLAQIFGLPHDTGADIVPRGSVRIGLTQDLASNYAVKSRGQEQITLDGETYRIALAARYGIAQAWEAGFEIPYINQSGGFLDQFVIDWHNTFGLPQGGRNSAPHNRLNYSYTNGGEQKLHMTSLGSGLGDISLTGGYSIIDDHDAGRHDRLAVKAAVKLPTGASSRLFGSGSTDLMLQMCGSMSRDSEWGTLALYGSIGGLAMSGSDVLRDQHVPLAGVGTFGLGWSPASWLSFKTQLNANTPLYRGSSLEEVSGSPVLLVLGGTLGFPRGYLLDIGVGEDLNVGTAPDVSFHLGLSKRF
jgi:hypothetical protein